MEKEIEHLRKEHEKDLDCITALTEQIEELNKKLENQKMSELMSKKQEIEKEIDEESYRLFMNQPRKPLEKEQTEQPKPIKSLDEILLED